MVTGAFIFMTKECSPSTHNAVVRHKTGRVLMYAVNTIEEGAQLAKHLMENEGCQIIELCGGFGEEGTRLVSAAVEGKIPLGYVVYLPEDLEKVEAFERYADEEFERIKAME